MTHFFLGLSFIMGTVAIMAFKEDPRTAWFELGVAGVAAVLAIATRRTV